MAKKDNKHSKLAMNDRMLIQACIAKGESAASIAKRIGFSASTVYREIERGSQIRNPGAGKCPKVGRLGICNFCGKRSYCRFEKRFYDYESADAEAERRRRESRSGTRVSAGGVAKLDSLSQQIMLMYGKEASNRKQEIDRQHYTIPNQRPKDKHCGKI